MKLKFLNIVFKDSKNFFSDIDHVLKSGKGFNSRVNNVLTFDSIKTFNHLMTINKIQILRIISQLKPDSIYQLAMILHREPQHVLKDCRQLQAYRFIKLEKTDSARSSLRPVLSFDYDVIRADSFIIAPYTISAKVEKLLLGNKAAV